MPKLTFSIDVTDDELAAVRSDPNPTVVATRILTLRILKWQGQYLAQESLEAFTARFTQGHF